MFFTKTLHFLQEKATQSRSVQVRSLSPYTTMPPIVFEYSILLRQGLKPFSGVSVGQFEGSELLLSWESGFFFVFTIINGGESAWLLRNAADAPLKSPESEQYCFLEHSFCYWEHYKNENTDARENSSLIWSDIGIFCLHHYTYDSPQFFRDLCFSQLHWKKLWNLHQLHNYLPSEDLHTNRNLQKQRCPKCKVNLSGVLSLISKAWLLTPALRCAVVVHRTT